MQYEWKIIYIDQESETFRKTLRILAFFGAIIFISFAVFDILRDNSVDSSSFLDLSLKIETMIIGIPGILLLWYSLVGKGTFGESYVEFDAKCLYWKIVDDGQYTYWKLKYRGNNKYFIEGEIEYDQIEDMSLESESIKIKYRNDVFQLYRVDAGEAGYEELLNELKKLKKYLRIN